MMLFTSSGQKPACKTAVRSGDRIGSVLIDVCWVLPPDEQHALVPECASTAAAAIQGCCQLAAGEALHSSPHPHLLHPP
jgi:hypothetical protein